MVCKEKRTVEMTQNLGLCKLDYILLNERKYAQSLSWLLNLIVNNSVLIQPKSFAKWNGSSFKDKKCHEVYDSSAGQIYVMPLNKWKCGHIRTNEGK